MKKQLEINIFSHDEYDKNKYILNPVEITMSEPELNCLIKILKEYRSLKKLDDSDPKAVSKMNVAKIIIDRISK